MTQKEWFTSDYHFYHRNILKYTTRPCATVEEMNEFLIKNHNSVVSKHDMVYHLGDLCFGSREQKLEILNRLNGQFHIILGNHDGGLRAAIESKYKVGKSKVLTINDSRLIRIHNQGIFLFHYACRTWPENNRNTWMLYGHSHGSLDEFKVAQTLSDGTTKEVLLKTMDVGIDTCVGEKHQRYFPYNFWEIKEIMDKRGFVPQDHHGVDEAENLTSSSSSVTMPL